MAKLILLSVIIASLAIPTRLSKMADPRKAIRKLVIAVLVFNAFYILALRFLYMRFV
jgi:hypothetical protein